MIEGSVRRGREVGNKEGISFKGTEKRRRTITGGKEEKYRGKGLRKRPGSRTEGREGKIEGRKRIQGQGRVKTKEGIEKK